jgi:uncharacterized peroxidase-related enzyme
MSGTGFLALPESTGEAQRLFDDDIAEIGYVMNASKVWAHQPATVAGLFDLMRDASSVADLSFRQRAILVAACASAFGDSYCSLAWGSKLANAADPRTAGDVLQGDDHRLSTSEQALASWARTVAKDPNHASEADVQALRDAGYDDAQIFGITVFVALRVAFSTVNDSLGMRPDAQFGSIAPEAVLEAVTFGRSIDEQTSGSGIDRSG